MAFEDLEIDPEIRNARTLPGAVYDDPAAFQCQRDRVFARTWHVRPSLAGLSREQNIVPWDLLPGCLDEPLLLTKDAAGTTHLLSNVCTHRAQVLVDKPCAGKGMRCAYHGRRFDLDGALHSAPGFEGALEFPSPSDDLPRVPRARWAQFEFASLDPAHSFETWAAPMMQRLAHLPLDAMVRAPQYDRSYEVDANWALYCDNYLEGFHVPYVHPGLSRAIEYETYRTETLELGTLQVAQASPDELCFELPNNHVDHGQRVAAYYYWLFPTTMFNVYPWGISVNAVLPQGPNATRVEFMRYIWDADHHDTGAGSDLNQVQLEDEVVVASTARGARSRLYESGRYAPRHEVGVHHFHRLLARFMRGQ